MKPLYYYHNLHLEMMDQPFPLWWLLKRHRPGIQIHLGNEVLTYNPGRQALIDLVKRDCVCQDCGLRPTHFALSRIYALRGKKKGVSTQLQLRPVAWDPVYDKAVFFNKDHRIPKSSGGLDALENMALSCEPCNSAKSRFSAPPPSWLNPRMFAVAEMQMNWQDTANNMMMRSYKK